MLNAFEVWFSGSLDSHKKQKDSLETWVVYIEITLVFWDLLNGPKQSESILWSMASSEGDQLITGAFHAIYGLNRARLIYLKLQTSGIESESSYIKDTFSERFQL